MLCYIPEKQNSVSVQWYEGTAVWLCERNCSMDSGAAALQIISRVFAPISAQYSHIMTNHSAVLRLISRSSPSEDIHTADKDATETISCIKIGRVGGSFQNSASTNAETPVDHK